MITLHYLENSRAVRILWALEELGSEYQIQYYKRLPDLSAPAELKAVHPLGKAPVLVDAEKTIAESAVILDYLQAVYDSEQQFKPSSSTELAEYEFWMHYAEGSLMPLLLIQLVMNRVELAVPFFIQPIVKQVTGGVKNKFIAPRLKDHITYLENYLAEHQYFAADFSFADIQMYYPLEALSTRTAIEHPNIKTFLNRVEERPAFKKTQEIIKRLA